MKDRINLIPLEILRRRRAKTRNTYLAIAFVAFMSFLALFYVILFVQVRLEENDLEVVKEERKAVRSQISQYELYEQRESEYQIRKKMVENAKTGEIKWSKIFNKLSMLMPDKVVFTTFKGDEQMIEAQIESLDYVSVAGSLVQLTNMADFSDEVVLKDVNKDIETNRIVFNVNTYHAGVTIAKEKKTSTSGGGTPK